jgi:CRISPR/Cas system-associated endonuclease Cas1
VTTVGIARIIRLAHASDQNLEPAPVGKRRRREGHDPINAALDILSSFLLRDMLVAIEQARAPA